MKKIYLIIGFLALVIEIQSQEIVYDSFNYTIGNLDTNGGWVSRSTGTDILIIDDNLSYPGFTASVGNAAQFSTSLGGKDPQLAFSTQTSGTVYASFLLKVTDVSGVTSPRYSLGLSNSSDPETSSGNYTACLYIKPSTGGYQVGINQGTIDTDTQWATQEYALNEVILVVVSYDITYQVSNLWINPNPSSFGSISEPTFNAATSVGNFPGTNSNTISSIFLRQTNTQNPIMVFDELRIGTTWAAVTPKLTGLDNLIQSNSLKLSTNILKNQVYVIGDKDVSKVDFYSLDSKLVKSLTVNRDNAISVTDLQKGMYLVRITSGIETNTQKVIKE